MRIVLPVLALLYCLSASAAEFDAPYVMRDAAGKLESWSVEAASEGLRKRTAPISPGGSITVPPVGSLPSFTVKIRSPAGPAADQVKAHAAAPLFVVADTHGEYEILVQMLRAHRVVDDKLRWSFGRGQLVFLGDVFDRGAHQTEILWLIYELEAQALEARGAVNFVLGNHETMVMSGDLRYLNPKYAQTTAALGVNSYSELFGMNSVLGQWLRSKPAVLKVNDLLCLHGGISARLIDRKFALADINSAIRASLSGGQFASDAERDRAAFLFSDSGPLWYRGYFERDSRPAETSTKDVERIREHFGVTRVLVGHTTVPTITLLYGGQVIAVQVYPKLSSFGYPEFEALLIRGKEFLRARPDGRTERLLP